MKRLRRIKILICNTDDAAIAKIDKMCSRVVNLNQHPYLSVFIEDLFTKQKHVMRPDEEYIVASNDQWEETFSKEKIRGTLYFKQCQHCR